MSERLLDRREFLARLNCSSATLHRKIVAGEIPRPLILGVKMRRWTESTVDEYINSLVIDENPTPVAPGAKRGRPSKGGQ
jgi:predicted DNA-binding transcriptional regulator AlpA